MTIRPDKPESQDDEHLKWSSRTPEKTGYYYWLPRANLEADAEVSLIQYAWVDFSQQQKLVIINGNTCKQISRMRRIWCGPLKPPPPVPSFEAGK